MKRALDSTLAIGVLLFATLGVSAGTANAAPATETPQVCSSPNPNICSSRPAPGQSPATPGHHPSARPGHHHSAKPGHRGGKNSGVGSGVLSSPAPIRVPVNICGNGIVVINPLNPAFGNICVNA
ncbi:MAG: DUF320 domain-containing protein [Pseudonocardia sp.]|nr:MULTISPECIES: chaplin [unclassified Pseudonocardia]MBN9101067.1 DUF320 domain-containing protein [Pseudonocardia sp.]